MRHNVKAGVLFEENLKKLSLIEYTPASNTILLMQWFLCNVYNV